MPSRVPIIIVMFVAHVLGPCSLASWSTLIDTRQSAFFPHTLGRTIEMYSSFPMAWWNFIALDIQTEDDFKYTRELCQAFTSELSPWVEWAECSGEFANQLMVLRDWARDYPLRRERPSDELLLSSLRTALAKASLPMGRSMLELLQSDPLQSYLELRALLERRNHLDLSRKGGFFFDARHQRVLLPVKFSFPPSEVRITGSFYGRVQQLCAHSGFCERLAFVGPHASTLENKERVLADVAWVSWFTGIGLAIFFVVLCGLRRWKFLWIAPAIALSIAISAGLTILIDGSIHGLVLAFGSGIVGIALDYGLHAALNPEEKRVWRSNTAGLITTIVVLFTLMFSSIPLLRQMMVFSVLGLSLAFGFLYVLDMNFHRFSGSPTLSIQPKGRSFYIYLVALLSLGGVLGVFTLRPELSLEQFNYQSPKNREISKWLIESTGFTVPLIQMDRIESGTLDKSREQLEWAEQNGLSIVSIAQYLPPLSEQTDHLITWGGVHCDPGEHRLHRIRSRLAVSEMSFFQPFLETLRCPEPKLIDPTRDPIPSYLADITAEQHWLTMWFPKDDRERSLIRRRYASVTSLRDLVSVFPKTLEHELFWMAPFSVLLVAVLLYLYYRRLSHTLIAFIPFLTGTGLMSSLHVLFRWEFSFVSLIATVMLYGLSVDYGIFATDASTTERSARDGTWTALLFASITTVSGFIPLLVCEHQVLVHLGRVLTFGVLGTQIGANWGVLSAIEFGKERRPY